MSLQRRFSEQWRALAWLCAAAAAGAAMVLLYPDGEQQDSGYHFLFARWAWRHPQYFVSVWGRPLFTFLYAFPAQVGSATTGYLAVRLLTVAISVAAAWQTWRLARDLKLPRAELAVPLLFLQPSFFLVSSVALTEPLFALVFVVALRLHLGGRVTAGMLVASLLILVRPEGFFLGVLWGLWVLLAEKPSRLKAVLRTLLLASGMIIWVVAARLITGDWLWIAHDWPPDWQAAGQANGTGPIWWYAAMLPLIVGPLLIVPFVVGLVRLIKKRELFCVTSAFLTLFILHSLMFVRGWFGSAGYPRYFVCVAPATAVITLVGWNELSAERLSLARASSVVLAVSALVCLFYVDGWLYARDARAVNEMYEWFKANERPVEKLIFSQAYMCIRFDRDPWERPAFTSDRQHNLELIRQAPPQTLVFWDEDTGPKWYRLRAEDFAAAGYSLLRSQDYQLRGKFFRLPWNRFGGVRRQRLHLLYKERALSQQAQIIKKIAP